MITELDFDKVKVAVSEVAKNGFGKVELIIQNGCIKRIIKSEDVLVNGSK